MLQKTISLDQVKTAMGKLRDRGERVSRRNVRQLLGTGGMSTVHKLMREVEELESLQGQVSCNDLSAPFLKAIYCEIALRTDKATNDLQHQIKLLRERETEALENLTDVEEENIELKDQLDDLRHQYAQHQQRAKTDAAVATETINRLESTVHRLQEERSRLAKAVETANIETTKAQLKLEASEQAAGKAENTIDLLQKDFQKLQSQKAEIEKKYSASVQKAADLREALSKAEKRIRNFEQRLEPAQGKSV